MTMTSDSHQAFAPRASFWKTVVAAWNRYVSHKTTSKLKMLASSEDATLKDLGVMSGELKPGRLPSAQDAKTDLEILSLRR